MKPSPADTALAEAALDRGCTVTPRQVMRWRQRGIVSPDVRGRGRGKGVEVSYPTTAVEVVVMVAQALKGQAALGKRILLQRAVLVAWLNGASVRDQALRAAFSQTYSYFHNLAASVHPQALAAHKPRFLGEPGPDDGAIASTVLAIANGESPPDGGIVATVSAAGLAPCLATADLTDGDVAVPSLHEAMDKAALAMLAEAARSASREELEGARDWLASARPPGLDDLGLAMAVPLVLPIVRMAIART